MYQVVCIFADTCHNLDFIPIQDTPYLVPLSYQLNMWSVVISDDQRYCRCYNSPDPHVWQQQITVFVIFLVLSAYKAPCRLWTGTTLAEIDVCNYEG